jgi:hypothetical protein
MSRYIEIAKDIAIIAVLVMAFYSSFMGQWDKGTFFMALACYSVLVRREDDV